jgi:hypothetical protein
MPSRTGDPASREMCARFELMALTRGAFRLLMQAKTRIDVRPVLPLIHVPTLVVHRGEDQPVSPAHGRYDASHIADAQFSELDAIEHYVGAGDWARVAQQIRRFLTGETESVVQDLDRVLSTVMLRTWSIRRPLPPGWGDRRLKELLDEHDRLVAGEVEPGRGRLVKTTGDGALALFDGPAAVRCAQAILSGVGGLGIEARAGVHAGEVELRGDDVGGIAVHIGARVAAAAKAGQVLVSSTVTDLVAGSGIEFAASGNYELKGVPGTWRLFAVKS